MNSQKYAPTDEEQMFLRSMLGSHLAELIIQQISMNQNYADYIIIKFR